MIGYNYLTDFKLENTQEYTDWINKAIKNFECTIGSIDFIFCSDDELLHMNQRHLGHDFYTDILTFQYEEGPVISGDIYISTDRVKENAGIFKVNPEQELKRVMIHGVLHLLGFKDATDEEKATMRARETELINMFHVKH